MSSTFSLGSTITNGCLLYDNFSPLTLFAAGEQGYWLDPSDFNTMFQGSAGNTPVTASDQSVGLILDKSQGLVRGNDLVTDVAVDLSYPDALVTSGYIVFNGPNSFSYARDGTNHAILSAKVGSALRAAVGVLEMSFTLSAYDGPVTGITSIDCTITDNFTNVIRLRTAGSYTLLVPQITALTFSVGGAVGGARLDNLIIRQIAGKHFFQPTASRRPIVRQDAQGYYYLQGDGVDDTMQCVGTVDPLGSAQVQMFSGLYADVLTGATPILSNDGFAGGGTTTPSFPGSIGLRFINFANVATLVSQGTIRNNLNFNVSATTKYVHSGLSDITAPSLRSILNGAEISSTATQGTGTFATCVPRILGGSTTLYFNGRLYQSIMRFGPNLPSSTILQTEIFINQKTGAY